jgi:hypothetical protein
MDERNKRIEEFNLFLKACGSAVWANAAVLQEEFITYLDEGDFSKILSLIHKIRKDNSVTVGTELISFYDLITSNPLSQGESNEMYADEKLIKNLLYKFDNDKPIKQMILIPDGYDYTECKRLSDVIIGNKLATNDQLIFPYIVSNNTELVGRITHKATVRTPYTLVSVRIKYDKRENKTHQSSFLGDPKELTNSEKYMDYLHTYYFSTVDEANPDNVMEYTLLSLKPLPIEDIKIKGMKIPVSDNMRVGANAKIIKETEMILVTEFNKIINEITDQDYNRLVAPFKGNFDKLYEAYFGGFRHPAIFEKFMMSWMFASECSYGPIQEYKPNLGIIGPSRGGKSKLLDCVAKVFREKKHGENITVKGFVPSFGGTKPSAGEFLKARRFCLAEEFINTITKTQDNSTIDVFKSLLVHDNVSASSGKFDGIGIIGKPTATFVFAANFLPPKMSNFVEFANNVSPSFLARFLIYVQTVEHYAFVEDRKDILGLDKTKDESHYYPVFKPYKVEIYDYLLHKRVDFSGFNEYDILKEYKSHLPDSANIREMYHGANEHLVRLIDGVTKVNHIIEGREDNFKVTQKDFDEAKEIWGFIIQSWTGNITGMTDKQKLQHLSQKQKLIYNLIKEKDGITKQDIYLEMKENVGKELEFLMWINLITVKSLGAVNTYTLRNKSTLDVEVAGYE